MRAGQIAYAAECGYRYLTGHFWYYPGLASLTELNYRIVTLLRHPVERFYSHYFYNRFQTGGHDTTDLDIETFLSNPQAREFGTTYVRYLGGVRADGDYASSAAVTAAAEAGEQRLDGVGFLEALDHFQAWWEQSLGYRLTIPHRRSSPARPEVVQRAKACPGIQERIELLCAPDLALYERLRRSFLSDSQPPRGPSAGSSNP